MMISYLMSAAAGVIVFFLAFKLAAPIRVGLSVGIFLILAVLITILSSRVGDPAPPDAVTIYPKTV